MMDIRRVSLVGWRQWSPGFYCAGLDQEAYCKPIKPRISLHASRPNCLEMFRRDQKCSEMRVGVPEVVDGGFIYGKHVSHCYATIIHNEFEIPSYLLRFKCNFSVWCNTASGMSFRDHLMISGDCNCCLSRWRNWYCCFQVRPIISSFSLLCLI